MLALHPGVLMSGNRDLPESAKADPHEKQPEDMSPEGESRRKLLKLGIGALGCGLAAVPIVPALGYLVHPLRLGPGEAGAMVPVGKREAFGAVPVRVDLYADRRDAWSRETNVKLGSCWVHVRDGKLQALSTSCPHLGCSVDYDAGEGKFKCPCHRSAFDLAGEVKGGPAPRSMDSLEIEEKNGLVAIRFQRFRQGVPGKEPV
jgi:nitrite reductase/ring-hydroxylating ferredoxin subunit